MPPQPVDHVSFFAGLSGDFFNNSIMILSVVQQMTDLGGHLGRSLFSNHSVKCLIFISLL